MTDAVTGAKTEVTFLVDMSRERLWQLVTDVPRYGEWSPECEHTEWLGDAAGRPPRAELSPLESFTWVVLDENHETMARIRAEQDLARSLSAMLDGESYREEAR